MSLSATLTRRPRSAMPSRMPSYSGHDLARLLGGQDVLAEQRRVRVEPALVEARQHLGALGEGLARDEALRTEPHAVLARRAVHAPAAGGGQDALAERSVDALRDHVRRLARPARSRRNCLQQAAQDALAARTARPRRAHAAVRAPSLPSGTPRSAQTVFSAEGIGKRSSAARAAAALAVASGVRSRTAAATSSGNAEASAEIAPTAPPARPRSISASGPTKMSSPSIRYGSKRSQGASETFRPVRFGTRSRKRSITGSDTG